MSKHWCWCWQIRTSHRLNSCTISQSVDRYWSNDSLEVTEQWKHLMITMEFFNVFKGLKKSNSETKLGERLSFGRKSRSSGGRKSSTDCPLPPRPGKCRGGLATTIVENLTEDQVTGPSLHSPRRDTDQFGNFYNRYEPLVIRGNEVVGGERRDEDCPRSPVVP